MVIESAALISIGLTLGLLYLGGRRLQNKRSLRKGVRTTMPDADHRIYLLAGAILFVIGFYSLRVQSHLLRRIMALNVMAVVCSSFYRPRSADARRDSRSRAARDGTHRHRGIGLRDRVGVGVGRSNPGGHEPGGPGDRPRSRPGATDRKERSRT